MKAWDVRIKNQCGETWASCVFAETRTEAKKIWFDEWAYQCCVGWIDIVASRASKFDGCYDEPRIFDSAEELKSISGFWSCG